MPNHIQWYNFHQPKEMGGRKARPYNLYTLLF